MAKQSINVGATANDKKGDSLRAAFQKVNANFTELYTAVGLINDPTLNLGAFEFTGSVMSTTDSTSITIDQATTISSNLTVGGDLLPSLANGGDLGSIDQPWRSLHVSNNTVFFGGIALGIEAGTNELKINNVPISQTITYADIPNTPTIPTDISDLDDSEGLLGGSAGPVQPYLEVTNTPFITQPAVLGTPVTITEPGSGQGAELNVVIENTGTTLSFGVATAGTGYIVGQRYKVYFWQIGGNSDLGNLEVTVASVGEQGELLSVDNAIWTGPNNDGTYQVSIEFIPGTEDSIEQGLTLTRYLYNGLYNSAVEQSYDSAISPATTLWNDDGWGTLVGLRDRSYSTFQTIINNTNTGYIGGRELVMWDTVNDRYYKFYFSVWDNNNTGAFSYTRTLVTDPNYFRKTDNGNEVDVIVEHPELGALEEAYIENETIFGDFRDQDAILIAPETRPWAGMPSYQAYDLILAYTTPDGVLPPLSGIESVAASARSRYLIWREALAVSVGITRDGNNGIYNPYTEEGWDSDNSPLGIGWNIDGWDDLTDVESRIYINFYAAYGFGGLGNKVPGSRAVMYVPQTEKYYAVEWLSWTQNNQGGGFSYTRKEIDLTKLNEGVRFPDGTILKSAEGIGRVKSTAPGNRRIEEVTGFNQVAVTAITQGATQTAVIRNTSTSWDFYVNATPELNQLYNNQGTFNYLEFSFDAEQTWIKVRFGGGTEGVDYQMVFEDNINRPVTADTIVDYRVVTGGGSVVWWSSADLPGGSSNFRGAVIDYHAYTGESTIIGSIHIVDDGGEEHISHQEVQSGSSDGDNDDLWLVTQEGQIRYRRIDGESKTLKIHWTAKVFYGSEFWD